MDLDSENNIGKSKQYVEKHQGDDLWKAIQAGNINAYHQLYLVYSEVLYNYGKKICSDTELVKDSIQDVFLILWEKRSTIHIKSSLKQYILISFKRELIRKMTPRKVPFYDHHNDFELNIEMKLIDQEKYIFLRKKLDNAIRTLSPRQKEIIFLRYYENMSYSEISELVGLNQNSLYKVISAAIHRLREHLHSILLYLLL